MYSSTLKVFSVTVPAAALVTFFHDAKFGRFAPTTPSIFLVNGIYSWITMELVAPLTFAYIFLRSSSAGTLVTQQYILAGAFLLHYLNRALISPLRSPSRSKAHISVTLSGIAFNLTNGYLQATWLTSSAFVARPTNVFVIGMVLWVVGLVGNVYHDEILFEIRRKARAKGKGRADGAKGGEHYAIPEGGLYAYLSFPNYFCEWIEWVGWAWAAAPLPSLADLPGAFTLDALRVWEPTYAAPWAFVMAEVATMLPRAWRGHRWYLERFGERYPRRRWVVLPGLL